MSQPENIAAIVNPSKEAIKIQIKLEVIIKFLRVRLFKIIKCEIKLEFLSILFTKTIVHQAKFGSDSLVKTTTILYV